MKETFGEWENIGNLDIDIVSDFILTGRKAIDFYSDEFLYKYIIGPKILDFGCGIGRNTFGLAEYNPKWNIIGYDNINMIFRTEEYKNLKYKKVFNNVRFYSNWEEIIQQKYDTIFCSIVLQHISKRNLEKYLSEFKKISNFLIVFGRRLNDDVENPNTWKILEEFGFYPIKFYRNDSEIPYNGMGDIHEHNLSIYSW